jgi:hypothetical protein
MITTLTKSRFKLALECPRKLVYATDKDYVNAKSEDEFLEALADGGHQVGELAKLMYPGGTEVDAPSIDEQVRQTQQLIEQENVTLYEPTFHHGNLVVRVDVLVKRGLDIDLIEVKSKGFDASAETFRATRKPIATEWEPYLYDVAYQTMVLQRAHPEWTIKPHLMLLNTSAGASIDGLGAKLQVVRNGRRVEVKVEEGFSPAILAQPLLCAHDVSGEVELLRANPVEAPGLTKPFDEFVDHLAQKLEAGEKLPPSPSNACKKCEFYCEPNQATEAYRSGWAECMEAHFHRKITQPRSETVFGLANHREVDKFLRSNVLLMSEIGESELGVKEEIGKISTTKRHLLQVQEARGEGEPIFLERETLASEMAKWQFPLHFIDFETSRPALPFHLGRKPNDLLVFQFSHHILEADGRLRHANECLIAEPGTPPSLSVLRALRLALSGDNGTVVHWWDHEKTVLKELRRQILDSAKEDRESLIEFIDSMVEEGTGRLADLGRLVSKTGFFQGTNGRSSIKKVLPAILGRSDFLRQRYGQPIYGTVEMPSLNFPAGWIWLRDENGQVVDPYKLLDPIFLDPELNAAIEQGEDEDMGDERFIANGGGAIVAYAELQRPDLSGEERQRLELQLKRYCELDTLAMVMVYEAIQDMLRR